MKKRLILLTLLILPSLLFAQRKNRYKYELVMGIGAANILGELGGANDIGTNFLKDLEFKATRPALQIAVRYKNQKYYAIRAGFAFGMLNGDDRLTEEPFRKNRNLHFRSPIAEFSGQIEGYFTKQEEGHLYKIKNVRGKKKIDLTGYGFLGIGVFYFNPQARYEGRWQNLHALSTEGQGLAEGKKKYSRFNIAIPMGIGFKYGLDRLWSIGFEYGLRKTFTDYIDDVSTVYFDNDALRAAKGDVAAYLADPSLADMPPGNEDCIGCNQTVAGQQRGDPEDNDAYMFATITVNYKFMYRRKTRSKF